MPSGRMFAQRLTPVLTPTTLATNRTAPSHKPSDFRRASAWDALDFDSGFAREPFAGGAFARDFSAVPAHGKPLVIPKPRFGAGPRGAPVQRSCAACNAGGNTCSTCEGDSTKDDAVQRKSLDQAATADHSAQIHEAAALGTGGPSGPLPFLDRIQRSFGHHDVSRIRAHEDSAAAEGAAAMGAEAFASGDHVAFAGNPTLRLAAHEAAHVVQQRGGVHLSGGVSEKNDGYERHADAVADLVVQGRSSEELLDAYAGAGHRATEAGANASPNEPGVQRASRSVVMRSQLFSSTVKICHRLLK